MSTRCTINFGWGDPNSEDAKPTAKIYRHCDGYPDGEHGVPADLKRFFGDVQAQTHDTRFGDPSYLAAKYVVWQADRYARKYDFEAEEYIDKEPLDFLSVGVLMKDPGDLEFTYWVRADKLKDGHPIVYVAERVGSWDTVEFSEWKEVE